MARRGIIKQRTHSCTLVGECQLRTYARADPVYVTVQSPINSRDSSSAPSQRPIKFRLMASREQQTMTPQWHRCRRYNDRLDHVYDETKDWHVSQTGFMASACKQNFDI